MLAGVACWSFWAFSGHPKIEELRQKLSAAIAITPAWDCGAHTCSTRSYVYLGKDLMVVEAETYVGLSITGEARLVDRIAAALAARTA